MFMRSKVMLAVLAVATLLPTAAHAEAESIAPPFLGADGFAACTRVWAVVTDLELPGACTDEASATVDGNAQLNLRATSPRGGQLPGYKSVSGFSDLWVTHEIGDRAGSALRFRFLVRVNSATASAPRKALSSPGVAYASLHAAVDVHGENLYDYVTTSRDIVSTYEYGRPSVTGEFIEFTLDVKRAPDARTADVYVSFGGYASVSESVIPSAVPRGEASVSVNADVLGVSVTYLA